MNKGSGQDGGEPAIDGRRRRGEDNRARIVAAMLALVRQGDITPSAERVAERAEVSLRTVFRHFEDMDTLFGEMVRPVEAELMAIAQRPFMATDWKGKVLELVDRRTAGYENVAVYKWAAEMRRLESKILEDAGDRMNLMSRHILMGHLPLELHGTDTAEALDFSLSFESWSRLRREQGLSAKRVRDVLYGFVTMLLASV